MTAMVATWGNSVDVATITSLLGADKAAEEAEAERLGPPPTPESLPAQPRALPAPGWVVPGRKQRELEDEMRSSGGTRDKKQARL
ncbi:hypothetical protein HNQ96_005384 [Aminobacter lissarensis]|uniref:Uncharacterized protein n=1 Tax=Aminobacter carboxidus TaxID=376165 RepID=A0A8E2BFH8_9HYPH|nr:hypothetical protein [Aminobacter lissarensis]MBB6469494.1 hypothetical protein [Aminobacter lissarensis]